MGRRHPCNRGSRSAKEVSKTIPEEVERRKDSPKERRTLEKVEAKRQAVWLGRLLG